MNKAITIAIMSDLHIGRNARSKDLCPTDDSKAIETGYKEKFLNFLHREKIHADYLAITGDISDRAQPDEFQLASEFIKETGERLQLQPDQILFVPGNHDVDWSELSIPDTTGFRRTQRYAPLRNPAWVFDQIMRSGQKHLLDPPHFSSWEFNDLIAVGYNSAWHDDPAIVVHHGLIADDHLRELAQYLAGLDLLPSRLRIFLVHHHPIQYSDPIPDEPDFSAMTNADKLLGLLQKYQFDLIVHGHKHTPNFRTYSTNSAFPLAILGSGSFSALLDTRWSGFVNNQFHLIKVGGRDPNNQSIFGLLENWTYLCGRGWLPSELNNGIRHKLPFGTYMQPNELKKLLRPVLKRRFKKKDYVKLSDLISAAPHMKYLPPERMTEILDSLSIEIGFQRHGEPPDEVVLLR
ncbi:MAG TPA: metallophosphoesterase [Blastocatellia bacterium]|nr:metallophosphoesterase [Blastocatellia bacterium]